MPEKLPDASPILATVGDSVQFKISFNNWNGGSFGLYINGEYQNGISTNENSFKNSSTFDAGEYKVEILATEKPINSSFDVNDIDYIKNLNNTLSATWDVHCFKENNDLIEDVYDIISFGATVYGTAQFMRQIQKWRTDKNSDKKEDEDITEKYDIKTLDEY